MFDCKMEYFLDLKFLPALLIEDFSTLNDEEKLQFKNWKTSIEHEQDSFGPCKYFNVTERKYSILNANGIDSYCDITGEFCDIATIQCSVTYEVKDVNIFINT